MKKVILLVLCFISFAGWSQNDQVMKLRKSKGPTFHKTIRLSSPPKNTTVTGPLEKNNRLKPWLKGSKAVPTASAPKIFGPKGKFLQNRTKRN